MVFKMVHFCIIIRFSSTPSKIEGFADRFTIFWLNAIYLICRLSSLVTQQLCIIYSVHTYSITFTEVMISLETEKKNAFCDKVQHRVSPNQLDHRRTGNVKSRCIYLSNKAVRIILKYSSNT